MLANSKLSERLQTAEQGLTQLQRFLEFVDCKMKQSKMRFCGFQKLESGNYLAYFLEVQHEKEPRSLYTYTLYAYADSNLRAPVYRANFAWQLTERLPKNKLHIDMQYIEQKGWQHQGVGTYGMDIAKMLARELQCEKITARKEVLTSVHTEAERIAEQECLGRFYEKNGFQPVPNSDMVEYIIC